MFFNIADILPRKLTLIVKFLDRYNNDMNGSLDTLTYHGGCPVLAGSKWITNKWIRSWTQGIRWPCATNITSEYQRLKPLNNDLCTLTKACDTFM